MLLLEASSLPEELSLEDWFSSSIETCQKRCYPLQNLQNRGVLTYLFRLETLFWGTYGKSADPVLTPQNLAFEQVLRFSFAGVNCYAKCNKTDNIH
ncbi:MAG: hypothetical protein AB2693_33065 [Candidatus Thiodiazotropha sp.]